MLGLITDRTQENVDYLRALSQKGWENMTSYERAIWTGDPLTAADFGYSDPVNLLPNRVDYSTGATVLFRNEYFTATGSGSATIIIGAAEDFIGKIVTLSAETISGSGRMELVWYNSEDHFEAAGCFLVPGYVSTRTLDVALDTWDYLAMKIYTSGITMCHKVMLELGGTQHEYVPYTPILPTEATKGAYNYSDLNRVEMVVLELSERWGLGLTAKTDWSLWDIPTESDRERLQDNLTAIANRLGVYVPVCDLNKMTYANANAIEIFLLEASKEVGA